MNQILKSHFPHVRLEQFDAVEVHPIRESEYGSEPISASEWGADSTATYYWGVFLHYDRKHPENAELGGLESIADYALEIDARAFASELEAHLREIREVARVV
jgi:hypothetical protein